MGLSVVEVVKIKLWLLRKKDTKSEAICMSGTHNSTEFQWQQDYAIVF